MIKLFQVSFPLYFDVSEQSEIAVKQWEGLK